MLTRARYLALALGTIAVGLLVHLGGTALSHGVRDVLGDALWGAMIFCWVGVLAPGATVPRRGAVAYGVCALVEVSQLAHAPWLDALRRTLPGRLVLGNGFDPRDLLAYGLGVGGAVLVEVAAVTWRRKGASALPM